MLIKLRFDTQKMDIDDVYKLLQKSSEYFMYFYDNDLL